MMTLIVSPIPPPRSAPHRDGMATKKPEESGRWGGGSAPIRPIRVIRGELQRLSPSLPPPPREGLRPGEATRMTRKRLIAADRVRLCFPTGAASARLSHPYDDRDRVGPALDCTLDDILRKSLGDEGKNTQHRVADGPASSVVRFPEIPGRTFNKERYSNHSTGVGIA